ncbi:histidine kinase [Paenibacillus sp. LHD-117]|uniref:sensor histidine kinase n=1 Tax=Paenibacillus sp. LHD-117 TaxID=3071412 RepID=UPI0027E0FC95|nr:histidine kinase [Paenibacillus sp. LHD-117]MDQ6419669.1 histidine kinase [Paenibacillus sp. LHD-117]
MIKIQTKLMVFIIALVMFLNAVALVLFTNSINSVEQYNAMLNRFFLLNNIYQKTINVNSAINSYVLSPTQDRSLQNAYLAQSADLRDNKNKLAEQVGNDQNRMLIQNYGNMINSFLEEGSLTIEQYDARNYNDYYDHLTQTGKISQFIQESTLSLINNELTNYQHFYLLMNQKNDYFRSMGIYIFLSTLVICIMFTFWFSKGITRPIQLLTVAAKQISRGNFDIKKVKVRTKDELMFLTDTFNHMCKNIRRLIAEIETKSELDQLMKKMEIKSLQNQINPHFLFNTFNMVAKMAFLEGAEKTSEAVESVSTLLRYNLSKLNHTVMLRDELEIVKEYFFIQKMRFGKRINVVEQISEHALDCPIPPLTLQPLVENAFTHGVESYEKGAEIGVNVFRSGGRVIVEVKDNGIGMTEVQLRALLQPEDPDTIGNLERSKDSNGIALRNVRRRLQLFYQYDDVMVIESVPGEGTIVRLLLPCEDGQKGSIVHVQAAYSG